MSFNLHLINDARLKIKTTAMSILAGQVSYVEGSRIICPLLYEARLDPHSQPFVVFVAIESETDSFPSGKARQQWNEDALAELDAELVQIEAWAREIGEEACRKTIESEELSPMDFN